MKAYYIDGKTSKRHDCEVELASDFIEIKLLEEVNRPAVIRWSLDKILNIDVRTSSKTLKYGDFPHQVLEFQQEVDFNRLFERYANEDFHKSGYNSFRKFGWQGMALALSGTVVVSLVFFFFGAPFLADLFARNIPKDYEVFIGENFKETYLEYLEVDTVRSYQIQQFYDRLNYPSEYEMNVLVVESDMVNAFALPGGTIVVFSGILEIIENEHELAGLLAHEASHINHRHSLRTISQDLAVYVLLASLTGDIGGFSSVLIENSNLISSLSNSRKFEKEADLEGIGLMMNAGLNPQGMVSLFKHFESLQSIDFDHEVTDSLKLELKSDTSTWKDIPWNKMTEILSTHPTPKNRMSYLQDEINSAEYELIKIDSLSVYYDELQCE